MKYLINVMVFLAMNAGLGAAVVPYDRFYPVEAQLVPASERNSLQARLDQYGTIRLEQGDYRNNPPGTPIGVAAPPSLHVRSGQRVYGLVRTIMPEIIVDPGCSNAVVSGVVANLTFPASPIPTTNNFFRRVTHGTGVVSGATLVGNLFLDSSYWAWQIDTSTGGYLRNNRFIRQVYHATGDACVWKAATYPGSAATASTGNVMLWANFLTPPARKYDLTNLDELSIINYDCEAPGSNGSAAVQATNCGRIAVFETTGTNSAGPTFSGGARQVWLHGNQMFNQTTNQPSTALGSDNAGLVLSKFDNTRPISYSGRGPVMRALEDRYSAIPQFYLNYTLNPVVASTAEADTVLAATSRLPVPGAWEAPTYRDAPTVPTGPISSLNRAAIQSRLDTEGVVVLAPGVYVLDGPLRLGVGKSLLGSGMDQTFLVGVSNAVDLITDDGTSSLFLADLTLANARNGIYHQSPYGSTGTQVQFTDSLVSYVCIRNMTQAGLCFTDIFGYDNNCFDHVIFANCTSGFKQLATHAGTETDATINYMDKNVFYQCQWLDCGKALDLTAFRASGGNCWIGCRFKGSTQYVSAARLHSPMTFVNCDLINNSGHPVVGTTGDLYFTACRFDAGARNPTDLVDSISVSLEGCTASRPAGSTTVLSSNSPTWLDLANPANRTEYTNRRMHLYNNSMPTLPLGPPTLPLGNSRVMFLVNNQLGVANPAGWSVRIAMCKGGVLYPLDNRSPQPGTRLLNGSAMPVWLGSGAAWVGPNSNG